MCQYNISCFFSDASLIANYDIKRCYKLNVTFYYQFPGGLTSSTIANVKAEFAKLFGFIPIAFASLPQCSGVIITREEIATSPPGVSSIFFRIPVIFTASSSVPDNQVSSRITSCINSGVSSYKSYLEGRAPSITESGKTTTLYNGTISDKKSCCGGDIPPPCCAAGSINVSTTKCGKTLVPLSLYLFAAINNYFVVFGVAVA